MSENPQLVPILAGFRSDAAPGHALLITAPWGAGKTFALRHLLSDAEHIFVSLFGVDSPAAFDQALFDAALARDGGTASSPLAQNTAKLMDGTMKILGGILEKHSNATIDISGQYRRAVLSQMPSLLVFDDLERARMPAPQLLALINRFVEHEGKQVILIANEEELGRGDTDYRRWREKVVGRTLTLRPEVAAALGMALTGLPEGAGKDALTARHDLIIRVFARTDTQNLRLLRLAVQDCADLVSRLPGVYLGKTDPLSGLIGTFIALSVLWNAGDRFKSEELSYHAYMLKTLAQGNGQAGRPAPEGLEKQRQVFQPEAFVSFDQRWLPGELAKAAIVEGYASEDLIAAAMRQAYGFQDEMPDWKLMVEWREAPEERVFAALQRSLTRLRAKEVESFAEFQQLFSALLDMASHGAVAMTPDEVQDLAMTALAGLEKAGRLGRWTNFGAEALRHFHEASLGYVYVSKDDPTFKAINSALLAAMKRGAEKGRSARLEGVMALLTTDPRGFRVALLGEGTAPEGLASHADPVFLAGDPARIAAEVYAQEVEIWRLFAEVMKRRLGVQASEGLEPERAWLRGFVGAARQIADGSSKIKGAQMRVHLGQAFDFLNSP